MDSQSRNGKARRSKGNKKINKFAKLRKHLTERTIPVSPEVFTGDYIYLEGGDVRKGVGPRAMCTCGNFKTDRLENFGMLATLAMEHRAESGHQLRQHAA